MPRFDLYRNPNPRAAHGLYLDVQSDLVRTATRWCVALLPAMHPSTLLKTPLARLPSQDQLRVESALDFMLRRY